MSCRIARPHLAALGLLATGLVSGAAQAALIDRGGGLIYDDVLNVTWLQDANYAQTSGYDPDGRMMWFDAVDWAARLAYYDSVRGVIYTDWRLPTNIDLGTSGCNFAYDGTDCGYNVDPASSEMAHLYYVSLGNQSHYTTTGAVSGAFEGGANPSSTLDNVGPFINFQSGAYWSGTLYAPDPSRAWLFGTLSGFQGSIDESYGFYALAVRPGDVAAVNNVPEPQTGALMLAGLGLLGWHARRRG